MTGVLRLPGSVLFGIGSRGSLPGQVSSLGVRAFVVADPFLAQTPLFASAIAAIEARGVQVLVYTDVPPELPVDALRHSADVATEFGPDVVIGYGGGSALDASKLVALLVRHGGHLPDYYGENAVPGPIMPLVAVPTTAGTGSEVTPVAVVADPTRDLKVGISSPHLIPTVAVVDPELTVGAPASVTAHAGIDALVHAVESYTAADLGVDWSERLPVFIGRNALSSALSIDAARHIAGALVSAVQRPNDIGARTAMALGSLLAGAAFGSTGTHLAHALQYPIGARTHTPHGLGTGMLLPYVLELCCQTVPDRVADLGRAMGVEDGTVDEVGARTVRLVKTICTAINLPNNLAALNLSRSDLPQLARLGLNSQRLVRIAPFEVDFELALLVLEAAWAGDSSILHSRLAPRGIETQGVTR